MNAFLIRPVKCLSKTKVWLCDKGPVQVQYQILVKSLCNTVTLPLHFKRHFLSLLSFVFKSKPTQNVTLHNNVKVRLLYLLHINSKQNIASYIIFVFKKFCTNMKCKQIAYHRFGGILQSLTYALFIHLYVIFSFCVFFCLFVIIIIINVKWN